MSGTQRCWRGCWWPPGSGARVAAQPLRWGAEGHREPGGCISTFYKSLALWIIACVADTDCKCLVPWLLLNYVLNKLLHYWPSLNYRHWADFTCDINPHISLPCLSYKTSFHKFCFAYPCKKSFTSTTKHAKADKNVLELLFLFEADVKLIQCCLKGKKKKKKNDLYNRLKKESHLASRPRPWTSALPSWWSEEDHPNSAKHCPAFFLVENLGLHIWKHSSLVKLCWSMGGNGRYWWMCTKWENWIILSHKLLDSTFYRIHQLSVYERKGIASHICAKNPQVQQEVKPAMLNVWYWPQENFKSNVSDICSAFIEK